MGHRRLGCLALALALALAGCAATPPAVSPAHLQHEAERREAAETPAPVQRALVLPAPAPGPRTETYSVVVNNVAVRDLLFALARDAKLNVDIHPGTTGNVTLNAVDQTLTQLLSRIARQADLRFDLDGPNLAVMPDAPYLQTYQVDYVNMSRDTTGGVAVTTQLTGVGAVQPVAGAANVNNSQTRVENITRNHFWESLVQNIKDLLRETDKLLPEGTSETVYEQASNQTTTGTGAPPPAVAGRGRQAATPTLATSPNPASLQNTGTTTVRHNTFREAAAVIAHPESGVLTVRATSRQHDKVREFIDRVMRSARRQVLIEATVAEVRLADNYQQGIEWQALPIGSTGFRFVQKAADKLTAPSQSLLELGYANAASSVGKLSATIRLLESFGTVKVLSSPKISVLNNQSAVLKVVDNSVYFTIKADTSQNQTTTVTTYTTQLNQVPVGFVMNVTPQVGEDDTVLLNLRPSISRIVGYVADPNPALKQAGVTSEIPVIRSREMESVLRVANGNIAVMGGLMEDSVDDRRDAVPGLSALPLIGVLFQNRNETSQKTELVVFLRPTVIREASLDGDYRALRELLPSSVFFGEPGAPSPTGGRSP